MNHAQAVLMKGMKMVRIYIDNGVDISWLTLSHYFSYISFYQHPYDKGSRPKKLRYSLAKPAGATWKDMNTNWNETTITWQETAQIAIHDAVGNIIGKANNRNDILHVISAVSTNCDIFITNDKANISSKSSELESICGLKIFYQEEKPAIIKHIKKMIGVDV